MFPDLQKNNPLKMCFILTSFYKAINIRFQEKNLNMDQHSNFGPPDLFKSDNIDLQNHKFVFT